MLSISFLLSILFILLIYEFFIKFWSRIKLCRAMLDNVDIKNKLDNKLVRNNKIDCSMLIYLKENDNNSRVFIHNISYKVK